MKIFKGITVSPGLVNGLACLYADEAEGNVAHYSISDEQVPNEILRLKQGFDKTRGTMQEMVKIASDTFDKKAEEIFNVHMAMLNDPGLLNKISKLVEEKKVNAEHAISDVIEQYINIYKTKQGHFQELAHDFADLRNRLIASFTGLSGHFECPEGEKHPVIVVAKRLTPYMVLNIPRENVLAFVTKEGGYTTHATILAQSLGVPMVFGIEIDGNFQCTDNLIVDGFTGRVISCPDEQTQKHYDEKIEKYNKRRQTCALKAHIPPKTKTDLRVKLKLNISVPEELEAIKDFNHDGIGLLRTEFLFLERENPPTEQEQYDMYKYVLEKAAGPNGGKPVTVRLLDVGADKLPLFFNLPPQVNPDLEMKGARAVEAFHGVYLAQAKALLRAAVHSRGGDLRVLYPMVSDMTDLATFRKLFSAAKKELRKEKVKFKANIPDGIMIETPAAAIMSDVLLKEAHFANIGSNDLLQYTLAASRGHPLVEKRYHILHPALIKLIEMAVKAGKMHNKEICLCGEIGSFEEFYPLFLKIGLRSFSVAALKFPHLKCDLMHMRVPKGAQGATLLKKAYAAKTKEAMDRLFRKSFK
ncbi:MAG: phosphoenolpyruvate--protein phosphotransferase [Elusimicrobia bacterium RIFOXYB2_FULL_48_7]|nr:MAG: phosphoenolpyruvate--protein phosphotransferase [Elusimicrobia bacterium RIFOXYB2_FULL_48_7]